jgi:hypothetical protein
MPYPPIERYIPPNVPLYLTPASIPDGRFCRTLSVPDDDDNHSFLAIVDGVLSALMDAEAWREFGALTPEEAAAAWSTMMIEAWKVYGCNTDIAPYWDETTEDDLVGAPPEEGQLWYGFIDTDSDFQANLENVFIGAFVAQIAGVAAAVEFITIAKAYRLAFRTGDWGGIVDIFVDLINVGTVDTYSAAPGLTYVDIVIPGA